MKKLTPAHTEALLGELQTRFEKNPNRHQGIHWQEVEAKLRQHPDKLAILDLMEETGGEPDVVASENGRYWFCDCAAESPKGRRSVCYDHQALESRKEHKPGHSAVGMAEEMGMEMLNEAQYRQLQELFPFDLKTSSWIKTPEAIRKLGGAIFCDRRYNTVFTYHNGAESYYAARGFRGGIWV